jgi:subtilisin family serine protease
MIRILLALTLAIVPAAPQSEFTTAWALDRINQHEHMNDGWNWDGSAYGSGITVYVVDNGITPDLDIFGERVIAGYTALAGTTESCGTHHGTAIASLIAGRGYGVAQQANVVSVRVLKCDGKGTALNIIKGLQWIMANADPATSVVNMSLGGTADKRLDIMVDTMVEAGFPVVVAAGNNSSDACRYSPARSMLAITVGASTKLDMRLRTSNHGPCLSIYAPGDRIPAWHPIFGKFYPSGTSGSTALVSGAIAAAASMSGMSTLDAAEIVLISATQGAICCGYSTTTSSLLYIGEDLFQAEEEPWHEDWWSW